MTTEPNRYSIVGMNFRKSEKFVAELKVGEKLTLVREPTNKFDKNAVAVWCQGRHIGYVPKTQNVVLAKFIDANGTVPDEKEAPELFAMADEAGKVEVSTNKTITAKFIRSPNSSYPMAQVGE